MPVCGGREDVRIALTSSLIQELDEVEFIFSHSQDVVHVEMENIQAPKIRFDKTKKNDNLASKVEQKSPEVAPKAPVNSKEYSSDKRETSLERQLDEDRKDDDLFNLEDCTDDALTV